MSTKPRKSTLLFALTLLFTARVFAQGAPSVRELVPSAAPAGARVMVTGRGLADPTIAVSFGAVSAAVVARDDRFVEVLVPPSAASGNVKVTLGTTLVRELPFTVTADPKYVVTTLAGGPRAQNEPLKHPWGAAVVLPGGNIAVADEQHHAIQLVTPAGAVTTLAGNGKQGFDNGSGAAASFKDPRGITYDAKRNVLYVSDSDNNAIRRVTLDGAVTTIAKDVFKDPYGLTVGADGAIYVADAKNNRIARVTVEGAVTTFAGSGAAGDRPADGALLSATFFEPRGIIAAGNDFYVADTKNNAIRRIANGQVTTVVSFPRSLLDDSRDDGVDGSPNALRRPTGIGIDEAGNLIVSDAHNDFIRRIDLRTTPATMTTIAGNGKHGWADGDAAAAQFKDPTGLTVAGAIYVGDEDNDALRRLCPEVRVTGLNVPVGKLAPGTAVRLFGIGFIPGATTVLFDGVAATDITWISSTTLSVKLPQAIAGGTVTVSVSSCGGSAGPQSFVVDNTAPALTITNGSAALPDNSMYKVAVVPVLTATDDFDPSPVVTATLNGAPFVSGTTVSADGFYTLFGKAEDSAGNSKTDTVHFTIDATRPVVEVFESGKPFPAGFWFNRAVVIGVKVTDLTATTTEVRIDGQPYDIKQPYAVEGTHQLTVRAVDALGNETPVGPIAFTVDLTPPHLTFTSHSDGQTVALREATIAGGSDDAVTVTVNGTAATVDPAAKTFTVPLALLEGDNTLTAVGTDRAGNVGDAKLKLVLDTRAPELTVAAVASCTRADSLDVHGTVSDPALDNVVVRLDAASANATVSGGNWSATIPAGAEGRKSIVVTASDKSGHTATESAALTVDRTKPEISLSESGSPFTAAIVAHPVALFFRATDADANVTVSATLDGAPYTSGRSVAAETTHTIRVTARDCAGNESSREQTFLIDLTPPRFLSFSPASGSKLKTIPASLAGSVDSDAVEVRYSAASVSVPAQNGAFSFDPHFAEGVNDLALEVVDRAGNVGRGVYTVGIKTAEPLVDIIEGGASLADGTVYTRNVRPEVRVFEAGVTFTATLDGAAFTSGSEVSANGAHTITATATDPAYSTSRTVTRRFTIDRSGPVVKIVSPANGATIDAPSTAVRVTADDAIAVAINGATATKQSDGSWLAAAVPLDLGENLLVANGRDAAGNNASDSITVNRANAGPALVLTFPPDPYLTNRPHLDVTGRVLRPSSSVAVTVPPQQAANVATDPAGVFRLTGATLEEGETTVVATASEGGKSVSVSARVIADFTPPKVRLLESGEPFADGATFATQAVISGDATDKGQPVDYSLRVDGNSVTAPFAVTAAGGHTAVITARDVAGNESRLERTFYVGATAGGGCTLNAFDPPDGATITAAKVELVGRSGGAAGVKVNGIAAKMSAGSFCASVELPQEGANSVTIVCTDVDGKPTGEPQTITLIRVLNAPSVTITTPAEAFVTHDPTIVVTGTLGNGAVSVDLNGKPATINGSNWTATGVRLSDGINVLVARAKNAAGRISTASRRVTFIEDAPAISITSPIAGFVTGQPKTDVSGSYSNVDPGSLAIAGLAGAVEATPWSDTTGKFVAHDVPLTLGDTTIAVTGRSRTGRTARAEIAARYQAAIPVITITSPRDNDYFAADAGANFRVSGIFSGAEGSTVDVNGVAATVDQAAKTFTAEVPFSTLPGGMTPVVARLAQPNGESGGFDSLRVFKLAAAPRVLETFPAASAIEVDPGVVVLVLFSAPMNRESVGSAFRLENANGTAINGTLYLDKDVLTFAPATTLTPGERYTVKVSTDAKDLAGQNLAESAAVSFIAATTAPSDAPKLTSTYAHVCAQFVDVTGTSIPGARVRLDYGSIYFTTTASATGAFSYKVPLSGQQGYQVIRVRTVGADGSLSPFVELKLNVDCTGPRVVSAAYDRTVNKLTIEFSRDVKPETLTTGSTGNLQLSLEGRVIGGSVAPSGATVVLTPAEDLTKSSFTLRVLTGVEDTQSRKLEFPHTQLFSIGDDQPQPGNGGGYITGEVYDATTGRPLAGANVRIEVPVSAFSRGPVVTAASETPLQAVTMTTDARGRYGDLFAEGAHTIKASANGYTDIWRQIIVPAGAGVIPIDIRLTRRGETQTAAAGALTLTHGGTSAVTRRAELTVPAGAVAAGTRLTLTATGAQSLAGLLPLGWSPLASAEIVSTAGVSGRLTFDVPQSQLTAASQTLSAVRYDEARDEWRVLVPVVNVSGDKAAFDVDAPGAYALVYADKRPGLASPPQARAGAALQGVADPCAAGTCPAMVAKSFPLTPEVVLPTGSTVATLNIDGTAAAQLFPSGTAVQAYIDEELRLADGGRELDPPFATDLLLYRDLAGNDAAAVFNLAPSPRAAEVFLEVGFDHIRVLPYPGRLDRGTLVGPEGGRVPGDDNVAVELPTGAAQDALRATASSLSDLASFGSIPGFRIVGGLQLTLQRATQPAPTDVDGDGTIDPVAPVELSRPARATFNVDTTKLPAGTPQLILAEVIDQTAFGNRVVRLAAEMTALDGGRWTTTSIDRERLPIDGIIHEGRYLLLASEAPIAFAKGVVRLGTNVAAGGARVSTPTLGVADLARLTGIFALPVPSAPAAPFALVPRTVATGDGTTYTHASAPAVNAVVDVGNLLVVAQPPHVASTIPSANQTDVALSTSVEVTIAPGLDPASIGVSSLLVIDATNNLAVAGTVSAIGNVGIRWTPPAGETLRPGRRYSVSVSPTVRGSNGTPLGQAYTFAFTTVAFLTSGELHPERIHITIPDANGVATITGTAGALRDNWLAIPVRRGNDFLTKYSVKAAHDGSFTLVIGGDSPRDRVTLDDLIDLRVLNGNGALAAIVPLTPFTSPDGRAFIAPSSVSVSFVSADGIGIKVPAGAFDVATRIDVAPAPASTFSEVPRFTSELILGAAVNVSFTGRAKKPLELSVPMPAGADPNREFFLGLLGQSLHGPRIMAVDTLAIVDGRLTTATPANTSGRSVRTMGDLTRGNGPKDYLQKFIEAGAYAALQMHPDRGTLAWSFMNTGATVYELVWDTLWSMYVGHQYVVESGGHITFPVPAGTAFTVTGYDPATSLKAFEQTYAGVPLGGNGTVLTPPENDVNGPYPVYASPFRIENAEAPPVDVTLNAVRDVELSLSSTGVLTIKPSSSGNSALAGLNVTALDIDSGERRGPQPLPMTMPDTKAGDRIVLLIEEKDIDPSASISLVFNEPIKIDAAAVTDDQIDEYLKTIIKFEQADNASAPGVDLLKAARMRLDSGDRRVTILLGSPLEAGVKFRLTLDKSIRDTSSNDLAPGQAAKKDPTTGALSPIGSSPAPLELWFKTRAPKGKFAEFDIRQSPTAQFGTIRETSQYGNLLFVAAVDGGVLAYDVSDPAALAAADAKPLAMAPGRDEIATNPVTDYWTVHVDHHGRVFSTGLTNMFGALRTWRVEDFIDAHSNTSGCLPNVKYTVCKQTGGAIISQAPGTAYGVGLPSAFVTMDRVEAIPRKVKFLVGDAPVEEWPVDAFVSAFCGGTSSDAGAGLKKCNAKIPPSGSMYRIQRMTVENRSLGLQWSEDAFDAKTADLNDVLFAPGDTLYLTRNVSTYAVINLFGWGLGVFDVNAVESNEVQGTAPAGYEAPKEQVALRAYADDPSIPDDIQKVGDLAFSPDSAILGAETGSVRVYALDTRKGAVEFYLTPPNGMDLVGKTVLTRETNARWDALAVAIKNATGVTPLARFSTSAMYTNATTEKHYLLMTAMDFGLVALEAGGPPLGPDSWADVIYIPHGARAVNVIERSNIAVVADNDGYIYLVDLSRIDERDPALGAATLFPTIAATLAGGGQDPRILWKSADPIGIGNIGPLVDPETGIVIGADLLGKRVRVGSAIDPKLRIMVKAGDRLKEVGSVIPLGIETPRGLLPCTDAATNADCTASMAVFRVETNLPGSMTETLSELPVALESETVLGAESLQSPDPYPVSHLRIKDRSGSVSARSTNDFKLKRVLDISSMPRLRYQKGWNRFATDWVVAIADPRAAKDYGTAPTDCAACARPLFINSLPGDVRELYTAGRFIAARPEFNTAGTYGFLAENNRLKTRITTTPADTVRPVEALVAAQSAPLAEGMLQETTYMHSGEVETSSVDYDAGGRAGWNVSFDRRYRSRTIGLTPLGSGWDSSLFRRLRALPNGDVEYRDGAEVWRFALKGGAYQAPAGLFLRLVKRDGGWNLLDQQLRITRFDDYGRLVAESDEFYTPREAGSGNTIVYVYDDKGRLTNVIDPLGRPNELTYNPEGLLSQIKDWHESSPRYINYQYSSGLLNVVQLPDVANTSGGRPQIRYAYAGGGSAYKQKLELAPNLDTITDPGMSTARVDFDYDANDRAKSQRWATGESATFDFGGLPSTSNVTDVLGQKRDYTLTGANSTTDPLADRAHASQITDQVEIWADAPFGQLPTSVKPGAPLRTTTTRTRKYGYTNGVQTSSELVGVSSRTTSWSSANGAPGQKIDGNTTTPQSGGSPAAWMPPQAASTHSLQYQSGGVFLQSMTAGGKTINAPAANRDEKDPEATNSSIDSHETYDQHGLLATVSTSGGTDSGSAGAQQTIHYWDETASRYKRGLPDYVEDGGLRTTFAYTEDSTSATDPRGVITTTTFDTWNRAIEIRTTKAGDALVHVRHYTYKANGLLDTVTVTRDGGDVVTTYDYDEIGRERSVTTNQIATVGTTTTTTGYNLAARSITTAVSGGATTTTDLDRLGRVVHVTTTTGSTPIEQQFAYDLSGKDVYSSDMFTASASAHDAYGREIATTDSDGTIRTYEYDDWGRVTRMKDLSEGGGAVVGQTSYSYTDAGTLISETTNVDSGAVRSTTYAWDGGGRTTGTATDGRAQRAVYDTAGRVISESEGGGSERAVDDPYTSTTIGSYDGLLPVNAETSEKAGGKYALSWEYDSSGNVKQQTLEALTWTQQFDQLGNLRRAAVPGRPEKQWDVDARGAVTSETLPGGGQNVFAYDASGARTGYRDPGGDTTATHTDLIGRPTQRDYADGTHETIEWEGTRVKSVTDRQGRKQTFTYNAKGQLAFVFDGAGTKLDELQYDAAGRLTSWKTADAELTWSDFNLEGQPKTTTQRRFKDGSAFASSPIVLDEFIQHHGWNSHGEHTDYTMPAPIGFHFPAGWRDKIHQDHDPMGNVSAITGLMSATYVNTGRPRSRTVITMSGKQIVRDYAYDPATSLLKQMSVDVNGTVVAGSDISFDGLQKSSARLLGVSSGQRFVQWRYDARSRVAASAAGTIAGADPLSGSPGSARDAIDAGDFRFEQQRVPQFDAATAAALKARGIDVTHIDPPTASFDKQSGGGHKIAKVTRGPKVYPFAWNGAERVSDGRFDYRFDAKGRLISATETGTTAPKRRILYAYSGTGRLVGRRAEYALVPTPAAADWKLEDRAGVVAADGLPGDTTFVWDAVSDNLLEIFKAGATPSDPQGGLLKQIVHGGASYDDPIETTSADPLTGTVAHLYPVYDEAGGGSLQAVLNEQAQVVARTLPNDPYGADDVDFAGAAVDDVSITAAKDASGALQRVRVVVHATEQLARATIAGGGRLSVVDADGRIVRSATVAAAAVAGDAYAVEWVLTGSEWSALTNPAAAVVGGTSRTPAALSVGVTSALRAAAWSFDVPILPPPAWATASGSSIVSSAELPVELREPLGSVASFVGSVGDGRNETRELYHVEALSLVSVGSADVVDDLVTARMHAQPFADPATRLNYVRARWYDPATGAWLTPDPKGYVDSSNLYSFAGGDPVNRRDPTGQAYWEDRVAELQDMLIKMYRRQRQNPGNIGDFILLEAEIKAEIERLERVKPRKPEAPTGPSLLQRGLDLLAKAEHEAVAKAHKAGEDFWKYEPKPDSDQVRAAKEEIGASTENKGQKLGQVAGEITGSVFAASAQVGIFVIEGEVGGKLLEEAVGVVQTVVRRGGRLGNAATRQQVHEIAAELQSRGWTITGGGGVAPEEYLRPISGTGRKGGSYIDITATKNGRTLRINTVDTYADGVTMTKREANNAARIRTQQAPGEHLVTIPKPKAPKPPKK
ncbi:MAG TPA: Ig-like domain-containing protein [Thermoanaerobaculia bacterium]|jgi:RHS repeat-associated protein